MPPKPAASLTGAHPSQAALQTASREAIVAHQFERLQQTSGTTGQPLKILDTPESWDWGADCWSVIYQAAGVTNEDILFLAFSFGPFIGFWSAYEGAKRVGALIVPGGGQTSVQRIQTMLALNATVLVCTPT